MRKLYNILFLLLVVASVSFVACDKTEPVDEPTVENPDDSKDDPNDDPDNPTPPEEPDGFRIAVEELGSTSCITVVTPADAEMYYVAYFSEVSYFEGSGIDTDEELFEDDKYYFVGGAEFEGLSPRDYMEQSRVLFKGEQHLKWTSLKPGIDYVLYIYGITFNEDYSDYEMSTPVFWEVVTPTSAELRELPFSIDVEVDGAFVTCNVDPEAWDGYYAIQIFPHNDDRYIDSPEEVTLDYAQSLAATWIDHYYTRLNAYGYSVADILAESCKMGASTSRVELDAFALYTLVVYAIEEVDGVYQVVSTPSYLNFSTEEVGMSDMVIDIEVANLYVRVCDLTVTPSVEGEQYIMIVTPTHYLKPDYTDEDIVDVMLGELSDWTFTFNGAITSHINTMTPDTEYVVAALGIEGGVVTTPLFKEVFRTEPEGECELAVVDVAWGGPYDISEAAALDPERFGGYKGYPNTMYYLMWMEVKTDTPTEDIFAYYVNYYDYEYFGADTIFYDLLIDTVPEVCVQEGLYYDPYYICAAAFDYKGNVTPMWRSEALTFYTEDMLPAQELIDKLNASPEAMVLCLKAANVER